jgi:hypothetical protein
MSEVARVLAELERMCGDTVERLAPYAASSHVTKFAGLEA